MSAPSQGGGRTWLDACTLPVGSVGGVPVRVHLLFFAVVALGVVGQIGRPWQNMVWAALVYGPVLWATILLHEGGHCFAAKRLGAAVHSITLWPLGGVALIGQAASPRDDMIVALAGPATHLPQVGRKGGEEEKGRSYVFSSSRYYFDPTTTTTTTPSLPLSLSLPPLF